MGRDRNAERAFESWTLAGLATDHQNMQRRASAKIKAAQTKSPNFQQEEREEDLGSESPLTELEDEQPASPSPPKKRRRKTKVVEPVVYDIPPVESKMTTFRGIVFTKTVRRVVGAGLRIHSPHVASRSVGLRESSYLRGMWAPLLILEGLYQHHSSSYKAGSHLLQSVRPFFWSSRNSPRTRVGSHKGSRFNLGPAGLTPSSKMASTLPKTWASEIQKILPNLFR